MKKYSFDCISDIHLDFYVRVDNPERKVRKNIKSMLIRFLLSHREGIKREMNGIMRKDNLTIRQKEILLVIIDYIDSKGYAPSIREIGEKVNLASPSTVCRHMENLKDKGFVTWEPS